MMRTFTDLALLGGPQAVAPQYQSQKHPVITRRLEAAVAAQLHQAISLYDASGIYAELETKWRTYLGNDAQVLSVNSGTSALYSAYFGLNIPRGMEVIVPCFNFFAAATPLFLLGLKPVLAGCRDDGNIDPESVKSLINDNTAAISVTHMWGNPCDMDALMSISSQSGVPVVEDVSHAHGARFKNQLTGTFGAVAAWSFQGKKIVTAGEGGMLATNDTEIFDRAVLVGHYNKRAKAQVVNEELHNYAETGFGLNLRMHPFGAAFASAQIDDLENQLADRRACAKLLDERLSAIEGFALTPIDVRSQSAYYAYTFRYLPEYFPGVSRDQFVKAVVAEGALDVDSPGATRPLSDYELFNSASKVIEGACDAIRASKQVTDGANRYWQTVIKLPTWHGNNHLEYANAYCAAIEKVAQFRERISK